MLIREVTRLGQELALLEQLRKGEDELTHDRALRSVQERILSLVKVKFFSAASRGVFDEDGDVQEMLMGGWRCPGNADWRWDVRQVLSGEMGTSRKC